MKSRRQRILAAASGLALIGCTANIQRRNEPAIGAKILRSDASQLVIEDRSGRETAIACQEIASLHHPGSLTFLMGTALGVASAIEYATEDKRTCTECGPNVSSADVMLTLAVPLMVIGGVVWLRSYGAASHCRYGTK